MPSLKLSYFDGKGRAEPLRWILAAGKQKFDQQTFSFAEWPAIKAKTPYGSVPILYVDGVALSQTVAIARYAGTISGLVASTPFKSAIGDEVADTTAEIITKYFDNVFEKDAEKKEAGEKKFWGEYLPKILSVWEPRIKTKFLTDDKPSWADVFMGHWLSRMQEVSPDVLKPYPNLAKVTQNVLDLEGIKAYLANPPKYALPL